MEVDSLRKITRKLGEFQTKRPVAVLVAAVIFTLLILPGFTLLYFDTSNENFLPENDPVVESLFVVGTEFSGLNSIQILFFNETGGREKSIDLRNPEFLIKTDQMAKIIGEIGYIDETVSAVDEIRATNNGVLPNNIVSIKRIIEDNPKIKRFYNKDFSIMRIYVNSTSFGGSDAEQTRNYNELRKHIESVALPDGVTAKLWGNLVQFIELNENLGSNLGFTSILSFLIILFLIILFYRSIVSGIMSIVPIMISLVWTIGTMGYINLPFTMLTSGFIPLVMGLGIDFSIHLIHSIKHLQKEGQTIEHAVIETMDEVGEAIFASTITTAIGFLSLMLASLLITQRLGLTMTLSVIYIFIGCMVIVPPVLVLQEKLFKRTTGSNSKQ